eukprot:GFUD01070478.1.p1 GENE.GFUD01070478.1~~GFUD01070478.1.p1  ORF type:complete len:597 (-),score=106.00 GFUD01070478.1:133-1923(-)
MDLDLLMFFFLVGPIAAFYALGILCFILCLLYLLFKRVYQLFGCDQCHSNLEISMKLFWKTVTHNLLHPEVIVKKMIKKILLTGMKDSKCQNVKTVPCQHPSDSSNCGIEKTTEVITIKEDKVKFGPKLQADTDYWVSTIPVAYYATLFTVYFWPRIIHAVIYETGFNVNYGLIICISISYVMFCPNFIGYISKQNTIPTNNHISETEALTYLTGTMACNAYVSIECYHMKSSEQSSDKVTTYSKVIWIPVTKWTNTTAPPCKDILSAEISKLLSKTPFFLVSAVLKAEPADEESKQFLEQFKLNCIEQNKHRDQNISATFSYKLMKNSKDVAELEVFRDGTYVPKYLLGRKYFYIALLLVVPLPALLLLTWKMVRRKMMFMKSIQTSMAEELTPSFNRDPALRNLIPDIPVVERTDGDQGDLQGGNCRQHLPNRCVCCSMMEERAEGFHSTKTDREYKNRRHYTCTSSWVIYLVICTVCKIQYIGQTTNEMTQRHNGQRSDIRSGTPGLGFHFHEVHGNGLDLQDETNLNACMNSFSQEVVASVRPPATQVEQAACLVMLDTLEAEFQHKLKCLFEHGEMYIREENRRIRSRSRI